MDPSLCYYLYSSLLVLWVCWGCLVEKLLVSIVRRYSGAAHCQLLTAPPVSSEGRPMSSSSLCDLNSIFVLLVCELVPNQAGVDQAHQEYVIRHHMISVLCVDDVAAVVDFVVQQHKSVVSSRVTNVLESVTLVRRQSRTTIRTPSQPSFLASETQMATWNRLTAG